MYGDVFWRGTDVCVCVCMCVRVRTGAALAAVCVQRPARHCHRVDDVFSEHRS